MSKKTSSDTSKYLVYLPRIHRELKKNNSFLRKFLIGIVTGLGTAVGATIVASLLVLILSFFIRSVEDVPILNSIIKSISLRDIVNQSEYIPE